MTLTTILDAAGPVAVLLCVLLAAYRWLMRPLWASLIIGAALATIFASPQSVQPLTWAKEISLPLATAVILARARTPAHLATPLSWAVNAVIVLNVLEATLADAVGGHWVNVLAGVALVITLPGPPAITAARAGGRPILRHDTPWRWIAAYTFWNLAIVCAHYPLHWFDHAAVLSAPAIVAVACRDRQRWVEARAYTLTLYALAVIVAVEATPWPWIPSVPLSPAIYAGVVTVAAVAATVNVFGWAISRPQAAPAAAVTSPLG